MSGLYGKLRQIGHGRVESASRALNYSICGALPFPHHEPVEIQIEKALSQLESLASPRYRPGGRHLSQSAVDNLVGYLDSQMRFDDGGRFSTAQQARYDVVLSRLAEIFPSKE